MSIPDIINGTFELAGGLFIWMNVVQVWKDKIVRGVHWLPTAFFTTWGVWNLYYYPHLNQWVSFAGGICIVLGNLAWVLSMIKFWPKKD